MFIKPGPGLKVRDPVTRAFLPDTGRAVSDTDFFWLRRLRDGDVVAAEPPAPEPTPHTA